MSRKVVFLDIDGVISPTFEGEYRHQKDEYEKSQPQYDSAVYIEKSDACAGEDKQKWIRPYDMYTVETRWDQASIQRINNLLRKYTRTLITGFWRVQKMRIKGLPGTF